MQLFQTLSRSPASHFAVVWRRLSPGSTFSTSATLSSAGDASADKGKPKGGPGTKASEAQLITLKEKMSFSIPRIIVDTHNYVDYHQNLIFEDNIRNIRMEGIFGYYRHVTLGRLFCLIRYVRSYVDVLKITHDVQDSKICIRWTFKGVHVISYLIHLPTYLRTKADFPPNRVIDGFSIMYVGDDGRIWKHVIEKMIPDDDPNLMKQAKEALIFKPPKIQDASLAVASKPE